MDTVSCGLNLKRLKLLLHKPVKLHEIIFLCRQALKHRLSQILFRLQRMYLNWMRKVVCAVPMGPHGACDCNVYLFPSLEYVGVPWMKFSESWIIYLLYLHGLYTYTNSIHCIISIIYIYLLYTLYTYTYYIHYIHIPIIYIIYIYLLNTLYTLYINTYMDCIPTT
jgi:hypothetical protein